MLKYTLVAVMFVALGACTQQTTAPPPSQLSQDAEADRLANQRIRERCNDGRLVGSACPEGTRGSQAAGAEGEQASGAEGSGTEAEVEVRETETETVRIRSGGVTHEEVELSSESTAPDCARIALGCPDGQCRRPSRETSRARLIAIATTIQQQVCPWTGDRNVQTGEIELSEDVIIDWTARRHGTTGD